MPWVRRCGMRGMSPVVTRIHGWWSALLYYGETTDVWAYLDQTFSMWTWTWMREFVFRGAPKYVRVCIHVCKVLAWAQMCIGTYVCVCFDMHVGVCFDAHTLTWKYACVCVWKALLLIYLGRHDTCHCDCDCAELSLAWNGIRVVRKTLLNTWFLAAGTRQWGQDNVPVRWLGRHFCKHKKRRVFQCFKALWDFSSFVWCGCIQWWVNVFSRMQAGHSCGHVQLQLPACVAVCMYAPMCNTLPSQSFTWKVIYLCTNTFAYLLNSSCMYVCSFFMLSS